MTFIVYPYKMTSKSARVLSSALGAKRVYPDRNYKPKQDHLVINWGNSTIPNWWQRNHTLLNNYDYVNIATDKLASFQMFTAYNVPHPDWTCDTEVAQAWIDQDFRVYGRKLLNSHSGKGIIIFENETITTPDICPLYTKSTKATQEFRIHVGNNGDTIIDMTQKKRRSGHEGGIRGIRNHSNGWVFTRQDVLPPEATVEAAKAAVKALNLNFGAVDVGYSQQEDKAFVYEVNTAPGLEGTTLERYVNYFKELPCL